MNTYPQSAALQRAPLGPRDSATLWLEPRYGDLECLSAHFQTHVYEPHSHETYVIGTIVEGCEKFQLGGATLRAGPGDMCFVNPDTVHDGEPDGFGYAYRMIYPSVELIRQTAQDLTGRTPRGTLSFPAPVVRDPETSRAFAAAHWAMQQKKAALEIDEAMLGVLALILARHVKLDPEEKPAEERSAVTRVRDYLTANVAENVDLATLSAITGLSRSHLIRAFKRSTGLTPHAFLVDQRIRLARRLLANGEAPVSVAAACGFADQPHMTRAFKARIGVTPGVYARAA